MGEAQLWQVAAFGGVALAVLLAAHFSHGPPRTHWRPQRKEVARDAERGSHQVAVKPSEIEGAGMGAFALRNFKEGLFVGTYFCRLVWADQSTPYAWDINETHGCDAEPVPYHNPMRYVNSISTLNTCSRLNLEVRITPQNAQPIEYWATRPIAKGEELIVSYGEAYFKKAAKLLASGVRYECGMLPVHLASARGDLAAARALLTADAAQVNQASPTTLGWTPLIEAAAAGQPAMAQLLLQHGANVNDAAKKDRTSALQMASMHGHTEVVKVLLAGGAKVDQATDDGATPLLIASQAGRAEVRI